MAGWCTDERFVLGRLLDRAFEMTFPASDPIGIDCARARVLLSLLPPV